MAARDPLTALKGSGYLVKDPTDLSAATPFGGTLLGTTSEHAWNPNFQHEQVLTEEWGATPTEVIYLGEAPVFAAALRSYDADALALLFPLTATGASSGRKVLKHDVGAAATRAGTKLSAVAHKMIFVPESVRTQPAVYFPNAVPIISGDAALRLRREVIGSIGCMWIAMPDSDGRTHEVGLLEDITL